MGVGTSSWASARCHGHRYIYMGIRTSPWASGSHRDRRGLPGMDVAKSGSAQENRGVFKRAVASSAETWRRRDGRGVARMDDARTGHY